MYKAGKMTNLTHMQQRIDSAQNWTQDNPVLMEGEIGYESQPETGGKVNPPKEKVGDGKTAWNDLPYSVGDENSFKTYVTPTVTIGAGDEHTFEYPSSEKVLTQVYEVPDGGTHDNTNIAFDSAVKYTQSDESVTTVENGVAELNGGIDSYTKLLLHLNNNATDSSLSSKTVTNNGVIFNSSISKFGGYSGYFNGSSNLAVNLGNDLPTGNTPRTIDFFIYFNELPSSTQLIFSYGIQSTTCEFGLTIDVNKLRLLLYSDDTTGTTTLVSGTWYHIAAVYDGSTAYLFLNGKLELSRVVSLPTGSSAFYIGTYNLGGYTLSNAYIDEFRISSGIARWTSPFTPPYAEYGKCAIDTPSNVTTTDSSNLSLSKVTKINSLTIPVTASVDTSVKILTSFDGRKTWLYHDNSGWHSFGTIGSEWTVSNSCTELQNYFTDLSITQLTADLGYTPTTIDFMFQLETQDASVTPIVSAITMNYSMVGDFECADVGSYDDNCSSYGLKITSPTQLSLKNKDTASHTVCAYITSLNNVTYLL